jgi:hypothetical protein
VVKVKTSPKKNLKTGSLRYKREIMYTWTLLIVFNLGGSTGGGIPTNMPGYHNEASCDEARIEVVEKLKKEDHWAVWAYCIPGPIKPS